MPIALSAVALAQARNFEYVSSSARRDTGLHDQEYSSHYQVGAAVALHRTEGRARQSGSL